MNLTGDPWLQNPSPIVAGSKIGLEVMPVGSMTLSAGAVQENVRRPALPASACDRQGSISSASAPRWPPP